ncbi:MAG TPA: EMC3/TMCO1 family protein [Candidatus Nanoarchaeia archaeon]|nr:EMC3/TMCO1 family protein [Candidatus Nanoarchaeia archaeon]
MTLKEIIIANPKVSIVLISFAVTLVMTLVTKFFTDQKRMKELKEMQKKHQQKMKDAKGDFGKQKELQKESMEMVMEMFRHSMKPMFITFIPIIIIFWIVKDIFTHTAIASTWLWWYIGSAIISSIILRKILDVV